MNNILVLSAAILCSVSGLPAINERITGGAIAKVGDFPYIVSITENDRHFCGGFIYSPLWVVTSASCVSGKSARNLKVVGAQVSLVNPDVGEQTVNVFSVIPIDIYNSTGQLNDIALLRLNAPGFSLAEGGPVDYIKYNEIDDSVATGTIMGWGATFEGGFESVNLRSGEVTIEKKLSGETCGTYAMDTEFKPATMICATNEIAARVAGSPCQFDEGGPLVQADPAGGDIVVGVMSKSSKSCAIDSYGVYTRVSVYYSWLLTVAGPQSRLPVNK